MRKEFSLSAGGWDTFFWGHAKGDCLRDRSVIDSRWGKTSSTRAACKLHTVCSIEIEGGSSATANEWVEHERFLSVYPRRRRIGFLLSFPLSSGFPPAFPLAGPFAIAEEAPPLTLRCVPMVAELDSTAIGVKQPVAGQIALHAVSSLPIRPDEGGAYPLGDFIEFTSDKRGRLQLRTSETPACITVFRPRGERTATRRTLRVNRCDPSFSGGRSNEHDECICYRLCASCAVRDHQRFSRALLHQRHQSYPRLSYATCEDPRARSDDMSSYLLTYPG